MLEVSEVNVLLVLMDQQGISTEVFFTSALPLMKSQLGKQYSQ